MKRGPAQLALCLVAACGRTEIYDPLPPPDVTLAASTADVAPDGCTVLDTETHRLEPFKRVPIDVLFVIDDSCSMADDQTALGREFNQFIGPFRANQVDFRLAAVTTDMSDTTGRAGRFVGPVLTDDTANLEAAFSSMVRVGSNGSADERALDAALAALREPLVSTTNRGFLRPEADLALIVLGDEDDHSDIAQRDFVSELRAFKPDGQRVSFTSIIGLGSCLLPALVNAWRLADVARAFQHDGSIVLCRTDYAVALRTTAGRLVNQRCIVGLKRPLDQSKRLRAFVDGRPSTLRASAPDDTYPQGSVELDVCPSAGGTVTLGYDDCWR